MYAPWRGRRKLVKEFTTFHGMVMLGSIALVLILMLWLMLSGYVNVNVD